MTTENLNPERALEVFMSDEMTLAQMKRVAAQMEEEQRLCAITWLINDLRTATTDGKRESIRARLAAACGAQSAAGVYP